MPARSDDCVVQIASRPSDKRFVLNALSLQKQQAVRLALNHEKRQLFSSRRPFMFTETTVATSDLTPIQQLLPSPLELLVPATASSPTQHHDPRASTYVVVVVQYIVLASPPPQLALPPSRRLTRSGEPDKRCNSGPERSQSQRDGDANGALTRTACGCKR